MSTSLQSAAERVREAIDEACNGLVQREALVELVVLCALAREHLLVVGPPGTAKSEAARRIARRLGGRYFEYLLGRFTEPSEIFGPIDLRKLKEGVVETETSGMLPEAEVAFLDEIFLGSTAILNTLLGVLNERTFRRGHTHVSVPLRVCIGATNRLPEDEQLAAFADRFLVRAFVEPIGDSGLEQLLEAGWGLTDAQPPNRSLMPELDALADAARRVELDRVRPALAHAVRLLRAAGVELSDRRLVRVQRLIASAAVLAGRDSATQADLWPLLCALPTASSQVLGREVLRDLLSASQNPALVTATAETSLGPLARGARIVRNAEALWTSTPTESSEHDAWKLRLESVAREIDATFPPDALPDDVAALRARIVQVLESPPR
jgi:MoxR-like ATPase